MSASAASPSTKTEKEVDEVHDEFSRFCMISRSQKVPVKNVHYNVSVNSPTRILLMNRIERVMMTHGADVVTINLVSAASAIEHCCALALWTAQTFDIDPKNMRVNTSMLQSLRAKRDVGCMSIELTVQRRDGLSSAATAIPGHTLMRYTLPGQTPSASDHKSDHGNRPHEPIVLRLLEPHDIRNGVADDKGESTGALSTRSVSVCPSQQVLLYTLTRAIKGLGSLRDITSPGWLKGKRLLELGGGMTPLAGIGLAVCTGAELVTITDASPNAVENQALCVRLNSGIFGKTKVSTQQLSWKDQSISKATQDLLDSVSNGLESTIQFDCIIGADILSKEEEHVHLVTLLQMLLSPDGQVFLCQPNRGGSMERFKQSLETTAFQVDDVGSSSSAYQAVRELNSRYSTEEGYDQDMELPCLIRLTRTSSEEVERGV